MLWRGEVIQTYKKDSSTPAFHILRRLSNGKFLEVGVAVSMICRLAGHLGGLPRADG
jgi:hypothetical protein